MLKLTIISKPLYHFHCDSLSSLRSLNNRHSQQKRVVVGDKGVRQSPSILKKTKRFMYDSVERYSTFNWISLDRTLLKCRITVVWFIIPQKPIFHISEGMYYWI